LNTGRRFFAPPPAGGFVQDDLSFKVTLKRFCTLVFITTYRNNQGTNRRFLISPTFTLFSLALFGMTRYFQLLGRGKQGRFGFYETPLLPPSLQKNKIVIPNEVRDLIVIFINWLMKVVISNEVRNLQLLARYYQKNITFFVYYIIIIYYLCYI